MRTPTVGDSWYTCRRAIMRILYRNILHPDAHTEYIHCGLTVLAMVLQHVGFLAYILLFRLK